MPLYKTSQEWLEQSALLLQARPSTTRITTKYSIKPFRSRKNTEELPSAEDAAMTDLKAPRGALELKTYDPASGVALKYRTTKAAEVTRLILSLGKLGRSMAALPDVDDDAAADRQSKEAGEMKSGHPQENVQAGLAAGGGGKKKKKGRK